MCVSDGTDGRQAGLRCQFSLSSPRHVTVEGRCSGRVSEQLEHGYDVMGSGLPG